MSCTLCDKALPKDGDHVVCGSCNSNLHYNCAGIKSGSWKSKSKQKKNDWECGSCRETKDRLPSIDDEDLDDPTYQCLKKLLKSMFTRHEKNITDKIDNVMSVISHLEESFNTVYERIQELEEKNVRLQTDLNDLKHMFECERQYGRSKNLIINGLPSKKGEDINATVTQLISAMKVDIKSEELTVHRLPSKNDPAPIIVQCGNKATRDNIMKTARKVRPKLGLVQNNDSHKPIYFNDHLTPYFSNLMLQAKKVKQIKGYKYIWFRSNKIYVRKNETTRAIVVTKQEDIDKIT